MKKLVFLIVAVLTTTMFWSCEDDNLPPGITNPGFEVDTTLTGPVVATKTFENSWESYDTIHDQQGHVIQTPWSKNGAVGLVFGEDAWDIKREDGWRMVTRLLEGSLETSRNYVILYNDITGILKVYNYCWTANNTQNNAVWYLSLVDSSSDSPKNKMLFSTSDVSLPLSAESGVISEYICSASDLSTHRAIENGWNVVKIPLSYDPSAPSSLKLIAKTVANTTSYVHLFGQFQSETKGKAISTYGTPLTPQFNESLVRTGEDATKEWLESQIKSNKLSETLKDAITGNTAALVADGLNLLGSSFFGLFSKRQNSSYVIELTTNTHGDLEGEITTPEGTGLVSSIIPVKESTTKSKLGSWNVSDFPIIYVHPVARNISGDPNTDENLYKVVATGNTKVDVVFNPELKKHIVSSKVECVPVYYHRSETYKPEPLVKPNYNGTLSGWLDNNSLGLSPVEGKILYRFDKTGSMQLTNLGGTTYFYNLWNKYGKSVRDNGMWNYIYVPNELNNSRKPVKYNMREIFAKVTVTIVTNYNGKKETTVMTRTYCPKIEWDPEQVEKYKNISMQDLQSVASYDHIVNEKE